MQTCANGIPPCPVPVQRRGLIDLIGRREGWLMARVLGYAKAHGYTPYTSTLIEAWRQSISGLSASLVEALHQRADLELHSDDDFGADPATAFGRVQAGRHRRRGVSLKMFLGMMKYYRQAYQDLVDAGADPADHALWRGWVDRLFDRIEIAFCEEWANLAHHDALAELQQANRTLANEKNRYLTIFESLPHPVFLLDPAGCLVNMNHAAARRLDAAAGPGGVYYGDGNRADDVPVHLADRLPWLAGVLADSQSPDVPRAGLDVCDDTGRSYTVGIASMLDVSGKYDGRVVILEEVTVRRKAEAALRARERFLDAIFNSIQDGISVLSHDLTIVQVNAAMRRLYPETPRLEGRRCYDAYHGAAVPCETCPSRRALASGRLEREEIMLRGPNGVRGFLEVFAFPLQDGEGDVSGVVQYVRDVTRQKQAEAERMQNERLQGVLETAGAVCHEMGQPLMAISGYSELLQLDLASDSAARPRVDKILAQIERLRDITQRLMKITRYVVRGYGNGGQIIDLNRTSPD